jgi:hypothetical protein
MLRVSRLYAVYYAMSSRGGAGAYFISLLVVVATIAHFSNLVSLPGITRFTLLYVAALWSARMLYVSSTNFYRIMALRNAKLYGLLSEGIVLKQLD